MESVAPGEVGLIEFGGTGEDGDGEEAAEHPADQDEVLGEAADEHAEAGGIFIPGGAGGGHVVLQAHDLDEGGEGDGGDGIPGEVAGGGAGEEEHGLGDFRVEAAEPADFVQAQGQQKMDNRRMRMPWTASVMAAAFRPPSMM